MTKRLSMLVFVLVVSLSAGSATAAGLAGWNGHQAPLSFRFGNDFDGHQQSLVLKNGDLWGWLYVHFSGVTTADGYRVAHHTDCNAVPDCTPGWTMLGKRRDAAFLFHEMDDHPVFLVDRSEIPQPGAYLHFHRIGADEHSSGTGYLLQLLAVDKFCFIHHESGRADPGKTCLENGGLPVTPGIDAATHLNIVTSAPAAL